MFKTTNWTTSGKWSNLAKATTWTLRNLALRSSLLSMAASPFCERKPPHPKAAPPIFHSRIAVFCRSWMGPDA
eukprot:2608273-Rhodomonas_salina.1